MEVGTKIEGIDEVLAKLKKLGDDEPKIIGKANKAGAKVIFGAAKANSPVASGFMQSHIKIRTSNKKSKGVYRASVGVGQKDWSGPAFYAAFVMWGHKAGPRRLGSSRKQVPGDDFLKHTAEEVGQEAADTTVQALKDGIEQAAGGK
jgi:HK97 gp10 family phage protein